MNKILLSLIFSLTVYNTNAQHSVARRWNEVQLAAIRQDLARPPVQARNLFHAAIAMYDAWAAYNPTTVSTYLIGNTINGTLYNYTSGTAPVLNNDVVASQNMAISYAMYKLLKERYVNSPQAATAYYRFDTLMLNLGYDTSLHSTNYLTSTPAEFGNFIASQVIAMGLVDGANESSNYANQNYTPSNGYLQTQLSGDANFLLVNKWQPLFIVTAFDQNNNPIGSLQNPVCHEWGRVVPFSLKSSDKTSYYKGSFEYPVYCDPGTPPMLDTAVGLDSVSNLYKWGNEMVANWSAHLDPNDTTTIDISPNRFGNIATLPTSFADYKYFYKFITGGDTSKGHLINPATNLPYTPQIVNRGDYTRVVSQYWADGPTSETPPGHWCLLFNNVSDNPLIVKKYNGVGNVLSNLEWDVKGYFTLCGALHDAAICAWGMKGWYDSPRPISAIRKLAEYGQCTDSLLPHYSKNGLHLNPGHIELVMPGDSFANVNSNNLYKIKIKAWKGYDSILNPQINTAGVGWILAENWMPYQRKTFITPPFAGFVSGHSTYSRAGAEAMTLITGNEYFPGGMYETTIPASNTYLVFENGPATPIKLQWATYRDASNEASLSRIWGGIHSPMDDMHGRLIGAKIGISSFNLAKTYFTKNNPLPTQLISFDAIEKNCTVNLNWKTASEKNIKAYEIWRSASVTTNYQKITTVNAMNNNETQNYNFVDISPLQKNYYKLIEIDANNNTHEAYINFIDMEKCSWNINNKTSIYPNPTKYFVNVQIQNSNQASECNIKVVDVFGKTIYNQQHQIVANENNISIPIQSLKTGNYFVQILFTNGLLEAHKLSVINE